MIILPFFIDKSVPTDTIVSFNKKYLAKSEQFP